MSNWHSVNQAASITWAVGGESVSSLSRSDSAGTSVLREGYITIWPQFRRTTSTGELQCHSTDVTPRRHGSIAKYSPMWNKPYDPRFAETVCAFQRKMTETDSENCIYYVGFITWGAASIHTKKTSLMAKRWQTDENYQHETFERFHLFSCPFVVCIQEWPFRGSLLPSAPFRSYSSRI